MSKRTSAIVPLMLAVVLCCCQPSKRFTGNANSDPGSENDIDIENPEAVVGYATYYGPGFHGKKTASGEVFDMYKMTCAHRTLPFGTMLRITNLSNNKSVKVRVNDRGPFIEGRILDLSFGAAQKIGLAGKALVKIEILRQ